MTDKSAAENAAAQSFPSATFGRRLASWVYDFLTAIAIAMLCTVVWLAGVGGLESLGLVDTSEYRDTAAYVSDGWAFRIFLLLSLTGFFVYFWVRGGQTIGMRAWRLQVLNHDGSMISIKQAVIRFYVSMAGLGNLWVLLDFKNKQSLQDYAAKTRTVELSKEANREVYRNL